MQISAHETDHVTFLIAGLGGSGSANFVVKPTFDFTVGGLFFLYRLSAILALAQAFEDTGVRAYKGQAANLMSKPDLLTAALQIHSVEARHASEVRRLRGQKDGLLVKIVEDYRFRLKELMMGRRIPCRLDLILQRLVMDPLGQVFLLVQVQNLFDSH
jgi:hypothetical protein